MAFDAKQQHPVAPERKMAKGTFKCFHCRGTFTSKDGDWYDWNQMQVHLCHSCEKATVKDPARPKAKR